MTDFCTPLISETLFIPSMDLTFWYIMRFVPASSLRPRGPSSALSCSMIARPAGSIRCSSERVMVGEGMLP